MLNCSIIYDAFGQRGTVSGGRGEASWVGALGHWDELGRRKDNPWDQDGWNPWRMRGTASGAEW